MNLTDCVTVFNLYNGQIYLAVIIHPSTGGDRTSTNQNSEIHLYSVNKDIGTVQKMHVLRTSFNGTHGLAMHSIDDVSTFNSCTLLGYIMGINVYQED